jgi:hypothetical protein
VAIPVSLRNHLPNTARLIAQPNSSQLSYMDSDPPNSRSSSTVAWPFTWIDDTFTSRARTEALLRPELDNSLRQADFENAVDFFSGSQRHLRVRVSTFRFL